MVICSRIILNLKETLPKTISTNSITYMYLTFTVSMKNSASKALDKRMSKLDGGTQT